MQEAPPPMSHPQYPLLDYDYDKDHRASHMEYGSMDEQMPLLKPVPTQPVPAQPVPAHLVPARPVPAQPVLAHPGGPFPVPGDWHAVAL
jgi:hypothetical protein